jgi:hypothetical protein
VFAWKLHRVVQSSICSFEYMYLERFTSLLYRDSTMGSVNASHSKNIELLEQRIQELNNAKSLAKAETNRVKVRIYVKSGMLYLDAFVSFIYKIS